MRASCPTHLFHLITLLALTCGFGGILTAAESAILNNPIGRIARVFDKKLVQTEDRVEWLDTRLATLARHREHAMKTGLGYRGYRATRSAPDPMIVLDLGQEYPINAVFLVPVQREYSEDPGIFPKRFTLEISRDANFTNATPLYPADPGELRAADGNPVQFTARSSARYLRLIVHEAHNRGMLDLFGLSEIAIISDQDSVSFGAKVTTIGDLNAPGIWYPEALVDGRTPLGVWQNGGESRKDVGDSVAVPDSFTQVIWSLDFNESAPLDRVILFPYQLDATFESSVFSDELSIQPLAVTGEPLGPPVLWTNPLSGSSSMTPLIIPLGGRVAHGIRITGTRPCAMGDFKVHALSEIEVWSRGSNIARQIPVSRECNGDFLTIAALTDGYASEKRIIPVAAWMSQLAERSTIETELASLRPRQNQQASESELNAAWGSAVILGLTFLIPVFIVERRRLMSRDQLDQLRKRIASDLHDDIGSNLGSISLIARTARKDLIRLQGPEEVAMDLGEMETIARESSLAMRDIVWLLERQQDSIGDLVQRMRETAGRLLREIHYTLECDSTKTAAKLSLDAKRHLFLFYKEAIHNVLKHSQANSVSIRLWDEDDKLALEILDNGIGLPVDPQLSPAGVRKLEDRARVLDGLLQVVSSKETGTRILLFVKRSHLSSHPSLA